MARCAGRPVRPCRGERRVRVGNADRVGLRPGRAGRLRPGRRARGAGGVPLHPRRLPGDVHDPALDDAPVRRLRHGRGVQRALPGPDRRTARPACRWPSTCPPRWAWTPTPPPPTARWARSAWPSTRSTTCGVLFDRIPLGEVSTSMTINAPAAVLLLLYQLVAEEQGVPAEALTGTIQNDVLKEYIARGTYIYPPAGLAPPGQRHLRLLPRAPAALEHDLDLRLPHGRGRGDAGAGGRLHPGQRHRLRRGRAGRRPRGRRVRAAAVVLLRRPDHAAGGGGQVPGRPADLGVGDAGPVRRPRTRAR